MTRKQAAVIWRIHLQKQNQKLLLPPIYHPSMPAVCELAPTELGCFRSATASTGQNSSHSPVLWHFGELQLCTYRNALSFQQTEGHQKWSIFQLERHRYSKATNGAEKQFQWLFFFFCQIKRTRYQKKSMLEEAALKQMKNSKRPEDLEILWRIHLKSIWRLFSIQNKSSLLLTAEHLQ